MKQCEDGPLTSYEKYDVIAWNKHENCYSRHCSPATVRATYGWTLCIVLTASNMLCLRIYTLICKLDKMRSSNIYVDTLENRCHYVFEKKFSEELMEHTCLHVLRSIWRG